LADGSGQADDAPCLVRLDDRVIEIELRVGDIGLIEIDRGLVLIDKIFLVIPRLPGNRILLDEKLIPGKVGLCLREERLVVRELGLGLIERDSVTAVVDAGDDGAGVDVLVVSDRNRGDVAGDFRCDGKLPRCNEGIVRRFKVLRVVPVQVACPDRRNEEEQPDDRREGVPSQQSGARRLIRAMAVLICRLIVVQRRRIDDGLLTGGLLSPDRSVGADDLIVRVRGLSINPVRRCECG
jgi:hypothetical protein